MEQTKPSVLAQTRYTLLSHYLADTFCFCIAIGFVSHVVLKWTVSLQYDIIMLVEGIFFIGCAILAIRKAFHDATVQCAAPIPTDIAPQQ